MAKGITTDQFKKATTAVKAGAPIWLACKFARIDDSDLREILRNEPDLKAEMDEAEAAAAMYFITQLRKHAEDDPKVSMFWLERRMRKEFGPKLEVEQTRKTFTITMGNPKTLEAAAEALPEPATDAEFTEDEE